MFLLTDPLYGMEISEATDLQWVKFVAVVRCGMVHMFSRLTDQFTSITRDHSPVSIARVKHISGKYFANTQTEYYCSFSFYSFQRYFYRSLKGLAESYKFSHIMSLEVILSHDKIIWMSSLPGYIRRHGYWTTKKRWHSSKHENEICIFLVWLVFGNVLLSHLCLQTTFSRKWFFFFILFP